MLFAMGTTRKYFFQCHSLLLHLFLTESIHQFNKNIKQEIRDKNESNSSRYNSIRTAGFGG